MIRTLIFCALIASLAFNVSAKVPSQRIVALAPHIVETLFELGVGDNIVGTVAYADYPQQALNIPRIGGYHGIQMEKLLQLEPDLVIVWRSGNKAEDITKLQALAPKLGFEVAFSEAKSIDELAKEILYFGELTGTQTTAKRLATDFEQKLATIRQTYQHKTPIKVFYQLWSEPLMTVNKNTWIHQLLSICQADNVFATSSTEYPQISIENVLVAQPQLVIQPDEKSDKPQPKIAWHQWPSIPAVSKDQFVRIDADRIHRFSRRMLTGLEDMCQKIDHSREIWNN